MTNRGVTPVSTPQRPSDALAQAMGNAMKDNRWAGSRRLGSFNVQTLVALRELGWDVVRKAAS